MLILKILITSCRSTRITRLRTQIVRNHFNRVLFCHRIIIQSERIPNRNLNKYHVRVNCTELVQSVKKLLRTVLPSIVNVSVCGWKKQ